MAIVVLILFLLRNSKKDMAPHCSLRPEAKVLPPTIKAEFFQDPMKKTAHYP